MKFSMGSLVSIHLLEKPSVGTVVGAYTALSTKEIGYTIDCNTSFFLNLSESDLRTADEPNNILREVL